MRIHPAGRLAAAVAVLALTAAVIPIGSATAAPRAGWKVGDCFAKADVWGDVVDLTSKVDCAKPHQVQVFGGAALPEAITSKYSFAQLHDENNKAALDALVAFSHKVCAPADIAPRMWPGKGAALAKALKPPASTVAGGALPAVAGAGFGWVFPDEKSFAAGDKSMLCVLYLPTGEVGSVPDTMGEMKGDARLLATSRALPTMRTCFTYDKAADQYATGSCALPHKDELLAYFAGRLPVAYADMTDAQWAPLDKQCDAIVDALVGADRKDLRAFVDAAQSDAGSLIYFQCYASKPTAADGTTPNLPGGTLVGLGKKPLKSV